GRLDGDEIGAAAGVERHRAAFQAGVERSIRDLESVLPAAAGDGDVQGARGTLLIVDGGRRQVHDGAVAERHGRRGKVTVVPFISRIVHVYVGDVVSACRDGQRPPNALDAVVAVADVDRQAARAAVLHRGLIGVGLHVDDVVAVSYVHGNRGDA